jgi:hypothetical protein
MTVSGRTAPARWGEKVVVIAVAPGIIAAVVLSIGLALERMGWMPPLFIGVPGLAWLAVLSPMLVLFGVVSLVGATVAAPFLPGRPVFKWGVLITGTLTWGIAFYWLSVPGLIDLP